jgi:hypothetical protein
MKRNTKNTSSRSKKPDSKLVKAFYAKRPNLHLKKADLVEQLKELVKEETIEPWFDRPLDMLDGLSPNQVIELGEIQVIQDMILDMASGNPT